MMSLCSLIFEFSQLECINFPQYGISHRGETFEQHRCHLRAGCETWKILSSLFVFSAETLSGAQNCAASVSPHLENNDLCCHHLTLSPSSSSSSAFCGFGRSRPWKILLYLTCSCSHLTADIFLAINFTMHCLLLYITDMYSSISFC